MLSLDATLAGILRSTREPLVGQMRLTWWNDALLRLDNGPPPAEPTLVGLAAEVLPCGVRGADLARMTSGWEMLLVEPLTEAELVAHGEMRGGGLFDVAARTLGGTIAEVALAGQGWALADVAGNLKDEALAQRARDLAAGRLSQAFGRRWPKPLRALGALALSARMTLAANPRPAGHPLRVARLLRFRLTGR
nr:hypothetical protein [Sphingomonas gellani]